MSLLETRYGAGVQVARDVIMGREPDILDDIHLPSVAASIWTRTPEQRFQAWIDTLPAEKLPELTTVVPIHLAEAAVLAASEAAGTPPGPELDMLAGDVGALTLMMAKIFRVDKVRLRLDVADEVMCPKFHADNVIARLLCSYRGPGTDYVPEGAEGDPRRIRQLRTGAVALFRGRLWPDAERTGLLHRSPALAEEIGARLLLVIDPVD